MDINDPTNVNGNGHGKKPRKSAPGRRSLSPRKFTAADELKATKAATRGEDRSTEGQLRTLLDALRAMESGDFSVRLPVKKGNGTLNDIAKSFNELAKRSEIRSPVTKRSGPGSRVAQGRVAAETWRVGVERLHPDRVFDG